MNTNKEKKTTAHPAVQTKKIKKSKKAKNTKNAKKTKNARKTGKTKRSIQEVPEKQRGGII